jgi:serine/threonine protein kinase/Tfp pilus assembly protein PilF
MSCAISSLYYARNPATDFLHYSIGTAGCLGMRMETVSNVCEKCGAKISADAPRGVCPACLLETGLGLLYDEDENTTDQEPMPRRKHGTPPVKMLADFGDYELLEEIGRGGQGVVYRAHQKSLNRTVALKVIGLGPWATEAHLKRFRREAEAAANLDHPFIVPIHEVGERDGCCYFSMNFVEGGQLDETVRRVPMSIRQAAELIAKLARTVHYAHEHGILHRDIKPGNILLDTKGEPHLTDFGLARLVEAESTITRTLEAMGTPSYMAPEQAAGNNAAVGKATDVYGLGAVFYELLTGHPPFAGGTTYQTMRLLLDTEPRQPRLWNRKIARDLSTVCLKCLEKDPQRRYSSALALAEDLEHWLKHEPIRAKRSGFFTHTRKWVRRKPAIAALIAALVALAAAMGWNVWESGLFSPTPEKSIAVLPFENLSNEEENAYFAYGVQDEILTDLGRIADLKVISRTSVMPYKSGVLRNLREIGRQLGVANVVEGTVRRAGNRVRINAQLVDARSDRQLWAQTYDRELADVFAIQSNIAKAIADELQAKLSPNEMSAIERPPTSDIAAFNLYAHARNVLAIRNARKDLFEAADLLNQAVTQDPSFFQAYCQLAHTHDRIYFLGYDHTPARLAMAEAAIQRAFRLRPDAGEAHLARAQNLYRGHLEYDAALAELDVAAKTLPNDTGVFELKGYIQRRQGKQEEAVRSLERAIELDPRNTFRLQQIGLSYHHLRRYAEEKSVLDRALAIEANDVDTKVARAFVDFHWKADTGQLHQTLDSIRATNPAATQSIADGLLICALAEHDPVAAKNAAIAAGSNPPFTDEAVNFSRPFVEGVIAHMTKDENMARLAFTAARAEQEKIIQAQPNYGPPLCVLGLIDAALGQKEEALREVRQAVALLPVEKDAINGVVMIKYLAMTAAWIGDNDLACEQLAVAIRPPSRLTFGQLKLLPFWDPLRGDPRFETIVASLAPKKASP